jgi:hypothetical protein
MERLVDQREEARLWDPATQLRHRKKSSVPPRPEGAPTAAPAEVDPEVIDRARPS